MNKKTEWSWIFYDWANSAFTLAITTAILPIYFKSMADSAGIAANMSTAYWGYSKSAATLLVALLAPILGTIADYKGFKKKFFTFFLGFGVLATAALALVPEGRWELLLGIFIFATIGFSGANIFYDAFLTDVAPPERMDIVSTRGFGYGYIGSTIPFIVCIGLTLMHDQLGMTMDMAVKAGFIITALWWGIFSVPMLKNVKQAYYIEPEPQAVRKSFKRLLETLKNVRQHKIVFVFLLAYFFYIDGVNTIISMATVYGTDVGIDSNTLLVVLLATQVVAFPFAILFGHLANRFSGRRMIIVGIIIYIFTCLYAYQLDTAFEFWVLGMLVASAQGGIQALSRSYYGKIIPKEKSNEFFGFYNIFGKFSTFMGPLIVAYVTQVTGSSQFGVLAIVALFIIGLVIFLASPKPDQKVTQAGNQSA